MCSLVWVCLGGVALRTRVMQPWGEGARMRVVLLLVEAWRRLQLMQWEKGVCTQKILQWGAALRRRVGQQQEGALRMREQVRL